MDGGRSVDGGSAHARRGRFLAGLVSGVRTLAFRWDSLSPDVRHDLLTRLAAHAADTGTEARTLASAAGAALAAQLTELEADLRTLAERAATFAEDERALLVDRIRALADGLEALVETLPPQR